MVEGLPVCGFNITLRLLPLPLPPLPSLSLLLPELVETVIDAVAAVLLLAPSFTPKVKLSVLEKPAFGVQVRLGVVPERVPLKGPDTTENCSDTAAKLGWASGFMPLSVNATALSSFIEIDAVVATGAQASARALPLVTDPVNIQLHWMILMLPSLSMVPVVDIILRFMPELTVSESAEPSDRMPSLSAMY
ncbi:hypothetical protein Ngar_c16840 [Candidatus Nitrososphaera gargensis Ga9.2]|uniref:Uncharacterized protein n=1 Tax=Nitrososphaera gargensis (strain Ga9.2) TaxID=1237085 RepID=K0IK06_NITGG|nr:hypothetical protein Ngar_c16840 [Candidatus Nitrososphaera gargensis Ga9.2]